MHLQSEVWSGTAAAKSLLQPPGRVVKNRNGWTGAAGGGVHLLKRHHTIGAKVFCNPSQTPDGIVLIHQHEAADDSVERLIEPHSRRIAHGKGNVGMVAANGTYSRPLHSLRRSIYSEDVPALADQFRSQETHVSAAATDIEDTHPGFYSGLREKLPSERCEHAGLKSETIQFTGRVAQSVLDPSMSRGSKL